jgi:hypothetical protein
VGGDVQQIEGAALGRGGGGEDGGEAIAPETDDIAGKRGEIAEQGVEAVHRGWFAIYGVWLVPEYLTPPVRQHVRAHAREGASKDILRLEC